MTTDAKQGIAESAMLSGSGTMTTTHLTVHTSNGVTVMSSVILTQTEDFIDGQGGVVKKAEMLLDEIILSWRDNTQTIKDQVAMIESYADEIRREQRELFRDVLKECLEAMQERRSYADMWEYKYHERLDEEDAMIEAAIMIGKE